MLESMSGVASRTFRAGGASLVAQVRSVNHRFLDVHLRLPRALLTLEGAIESSIQKAFVRGRVDFFIEAAPGSGSRLEQAHLNAPLIERYRSFLEHLSPGHEQPGLKEALQFLALPGAVILEPGLPEGFDRDRFFQEIDRLLAALKKSRHEEGRAIGKALRRHLDQIMRTVRQIRGRLKQVRSRRQAELKAELLKQLEAVAVTPRADPGAIVLEWIDRTNVTEELDRLGMHVEAVRRLLAEGDHDTGKRIEFFSQELLREANTIASKARDFEFRTACVELKTQVENIKEQVRNLC